MATTRSAFRTQVALFPAHMTDMEIEYSVPLTVAKMNSFLYKDTESHKFVTLFYGVLDIEKKTFTYTNAGHNPQLLYRPQNKKEEMLTAGGIMVGMMAEASFEKNSVILDNEAVIVLYTDGVTDAINQNEEFFGEERLFQLVKENCSLSAQELIDKIYRGITDFSVGAPQFDDITLIVLKIN
jgi:sigma-B regulation protein RsbU (phosphoserine phosphatase)